MNANQLAAAEMDLFGGRVPVLIGVTGHRSLGGMEARIAEAAAVECRKLKEAYPDTPLLVLTGLAEGADRLVTETVLRELDARLCAVLPLPPEEYARDFGSDSSRREFDSLLGKAVRRVDVYDVADAAKWSEPGEDRNVQYARAGALIAEQAQILFAVWDGQGARGTGGTAQVVEWFCRGCPPKRFSVSHESTTPLDPPDPGLFVHINSATAEVSVSDAGIEASANAKPGSDKRRSNIRKLLKATGRYNRDVRRKARLIEKNRPLLAPMPTGAAHETAAIYRAADALAMHYANRVRGADFLIYGLALAAVFFFNMINNWPAASWAYLGTTGTIVALLAYLWGRSLDTRFIEYRALAEAARVLFFLRLAGARRPVWLSYMSKHAGAVRWMRQTVRALEFCDDRREGAGAPPDGLALARKVWVDGQAAFYKRGSKRHMRRYRRWVAAERTAFILSFAIALALSVGAVLYLDAVPDWGWEHLISWGGEVVPGTHTKYKDVTDFMQTILGILAAAGVAVRALLVRRADRDIAKQYAATGAIFERAARALAEADKPDAEWKPEEIVETLGRVALRENAEWLWVRHTRPAELPS